MTMLIERVDVLNYGSTEMKRQTVNGATAVRTAVLWVAVAVAAIGGAAAAAAAPPVMEWEDIGAGGGGGGDVTWVYYELENEQGRPVVVQAEDVAAAGTNYAIVDDLGQATSPESPTLNAATLAAASQANENRLVMCPPCAAQV